MALTSKKEQHYQRLAETQNQRHHGLLAMAVGAARPDPPARLSPHLAGHAWQHGEAQILRQLLPCNSGGNDSDDRRQHLGTKICTLPVATCSAVG